MGQGEALLIFPHGLGERERLQASTHTHSLVRLPAMGQKETLLIFAAGRERERD